MFTSYNIDSPVNYFLKKSLSFYLVNIGQIYNVVFSVCHLVQIMCNTEKKKQNSREQCLFKMI